MKIKHYIHEDRFVIEVTPKDREEEKKIREFIEFAELTAEQPKNVKNSTQNGSKNVRNEENEI